jgi:sugar lactone lactonase YvrE
MQLTTTILLDNLTFPECPRWHHGALWFSDVHAHSIIKLTAGGEAQRVIEDAHQPAGLGWLLDGDLLYVRMVDRTLVRVPMDAGEAASVVADLKALEGCQLNDMTVSGDGRAYIGGFGFDINKGEPFATSSIYLVDLSNVAQPPPGVNVATKSRSVGAVIAADNLRFPNGIVITPDGNTLIVAETVGRCLTAFDIAADGSLGNRREWAALPIFPDGICLDAENAVWVASPTTGECVRVLEGGEVTHTVKAKAKGVYACMLGGANGATLYLCTATTTGPELAKGISAGWIETVEADVPHAGLP